MITRLDKFGRVLIPKKIRESLGIHLEATLNISEDGKQIVIEPVQDTEPVVEKNGILIFTGRLDSKVEDIIQKDRKLRMKKLLKNKA